MQINIQITKRSIDNAVGTFEHTLKETRHAGTTQPKTHSILLYNTEGKTQVPVRADVIARSWLRQFDLIFNVFL